jgi:hypothetical protein
MAARVLECPIRAISSSSVAPLSADQVLPVPQVVKVKINASGDSGDGERLLPCAVEVPAAWNAAALGTDEQPAIGDGLGVAVGVGLDLGPEDGAIGAVRVLGRDGEAPGVAGAKIIGTKSGPYDRDNR